MDEIIAFMAQCIAIVGVAAAALFGAGFVVICGAVNGLIYMGVL